MKKTILIIVALVVVVGSLAFFLVWYSQEREPIAPDTCSGDFCPQEREPIAPDTCSGDFCPQCKSKDVGTYIYGLYVPNPEDSVEVASGRKILGGCGIYENSPKYRCNSCGYQWGNHVHSK